MQVSNWATPLHNQIRDKMKERLATKQKIHLIRLNQEDVLCDKNNWEREIIEFMERIKSNKDKIEIYDAADGKRYLNMSRD